jgi:hypothetical protein
MRIYYILYNIKTNPIDIKKITTMLFFQDGNIESVAKATAKVPPCRPPLNVHALHIPSHQQVLYMSERKYVKSILKETRWTYHNYTVCYNSSVLYDTYALHVYHPRVCV